MARRDLSGAIDFDYLSGYAGGDLGLVDEVLGLFEHQVEMWLRLLDPDADPGVFRDGAHTLKGASLGIGAHRLGKACSEAEQNAAATAPARAALVDTIRAELDAVLGDIAAWRHEQALQGLKA